MKLVGLISGGKDSIYNLILSKLYDHEIVCLANLYPPPTSNTDELNSHMFQTVGHEIIQAIADAIQLPLIRHELSGKSLITNLHYETDINENYNTTHIPSEYDEIDDLYTLLSNVKERFPDVQGVSVGAILSNYQRIRVERIASKLGLTCYSYLWQRDQIDVLDDMTSDNALIHAVLIKLATFNMDPTTYLSKTLSECRPKLYELFQEYGMNVCGEGGEYESLTLDSCLQNAKIVVKQWQTFDSSTIDRTGALQTHLTVPYVAVKEYEVVAKTAEERAEDEARFNARKASLKIDMNSDPNCPSISTSPRTPGNNSVEVMTHQLPPLDEQLKQNVDFITSTYSTPLASHSAAHCIPPLTRCFLRSSNLDDLFSAVKQFQSTIRQTFNFTIRPFFVMICIPDMKDFLVMNKQYTTVFPSIRPPARVCVQHSLPYYTIDIVHLTTDISVAEKPQRLDSCDELKQQKGDGKTKLGLQTPQDITRMMQNVTSQHVEGISTWAPANIGPYSQYWRANGVFIGAGQIGLFPPTMQLYNCVIKQFLQTIKNSVACFQAASELHQFNNNLQISFAKAQNDSILTPSLGQFTSLLLAFDQQRVEQVIQSVCQQGRIGANLSKLHQIELLLSTINTLTHIHNKPVLSPDTNFDPLVFPSITSPNTHHQSNPASSSPLGLLFNSSRESHIKLSNAAKREEVTQIYEYLTQTNTQTYYFPPIVTIADTDITLKQHPQVMKSNQDKTGTNTEESNDQHEDDETQEPYQLVNNNSAMIFVPAVVLPRSAVFELCAVGLTNHTFKRLSTRSSNSTTQYGSTLNHLRWVHPVLDEKGQISELYVIFAVFIENDFLDLTIFSLAPRSQINSSVSPSTSASTSTDAGVISIIPESVLSTVFTTTKCIPSATLNVIQSQFFTSSPSQCDPKSLPNATTNIYPSTAEFDELNLYVAKIYADCYSRVLSQKSKQFAAVATAMAENNNKNPVECEDFFYPRPTTQNCVVDLFKSLRTRTGRPKSPTCELSHLFINSDQFGIKHLYHAVIGSLADVVEDDEDDHRHHHN